MGLLLLAPPHWYGPPLSRSYPVPRTSSLARPWRRPSTSPGRTSLSGVSRWASTATGGRPLISKARSHAGSPGGGVLCCPLLILLMITPLTPPLILAWHRADAAQPDDGRRGVWHHADRARRAQRALVQAGGVVHAVPVERARLPHVRRAFRELGTRGAQRGTKGGGSGALLPAATVSTAASLAPGVVWGGGTAVQVAAYRLPSWSSTSAV